MLDIERRLARHNSPARYVLLRPCRGQWRNIISEKEKRERGKENWSRPRIRDSFVLAPRTPRLRAKLLERNRNAYVRDNGHLKKDLRR